MRTGLAIAVATYPLASTTYGGASSFVIRPLRARGGCSRIRPSLASTTAASGGGVEMDDASSSSAARPAIASSIIETRILDGNESSMRVAAIFMVDAFWLRSCHVGVGDGGSASDACMSSLADIQARDLMDKYGERMGKRKLDAAVIAAVEDDGTDGMRGLVTVEVRLMERGRDLLSSEESEFALTRAVSSLGPKQRKEYKDASVMDIANGLLSPDYVAVCSLSNLCVSHSVRRRGVAVRLCLEAERVAREIFGFDEIYLRVEKSNIAALRLYEKRLGYLRAFDVTGATALRVDVNAGSFVEVNTDIAVLRKKI